ncbi:hypothetical protein JOE11_004299 [Robbsia andropogonis]
MTQARPSKQGWQPIQHGRLNAKREAGRIPRRSAPQVSKSRSHRQKRRCEIQRRRPPSSDLAMVDRGLDVASLAENDDAAARRARKRMAGLMAWPGIELNCCML